MQELVSFAEAASHVETSPDPSTGVTLLGLNVKDIEQANPHRLVSHVLCLSSIALIQRKINNFVVCVQVPLALT